MAPSAWLPKMFGLTAGAITTETDAGGTANKNLASRPKGCLWLKTGEFHLGQKVNNRRGRLGPCSRGATVDLAAYERDLAAGITRVTPNEAKVGE